MLSPEGVRRLPSLAMEMVGVRAPGLKARDPEVISKRLPLSPTQPLKICMLPVSAGSETDCEA